MYTRTLVALDINSGCHTHIKGWHTYYENDVSCNVANINHLKENGMKGKLLVVLCGPFTTTQKALVRKQVQVRVEKVTEAFNWLREHNIQYKDLQWLNPDEIPMPHIIDETV